VSPLFRTAAAMLLPALRLLRRWRVTCCSAHQKTEEATLHVNA